MEEAGSQPPKIAKDPADAKDLSDTPSSHHFATIRSNDPSRRAALRRAFPRRKARKVREEKG